MEIEMYWDRISLGAVRHHYNTLFIQNSAVTLQWLFKQNSAVTLQWLFIQNSAVTLQWILLGCITKWCLYLTSASLSVHTVQYQLLHKIILSRLHRNER